MSPGHMIMANKAAFDALAGDMAKHAVEPSWKHLICLMGDAVVGNFRKKDF